MQGNDFYLSSFIGSAPGYYKGSFAGNGQLTGEVVGAHGGQTFTGVLNAKAALPDPYNHSRGVEVVSIQYERQTDPDFVRKVLTRFRDKYHIGYDQIFGGLADKQGVANSLPSLNVFLAFPTTIIIDKEGKVAEIHTGYSGPATGQPYRQFVKEFNDEIDLLLRR